MTSSVEVSHLEPITPAAAHDANTLAIGLLRRTTETRDALASAIQAARTLDSRAVPAADAGLLVCALLATTPDAVTPDLVTELQNVIDRADFTLTWQPALDEAIQLLSLLVSTDLTQQVAGVATEVLSAPGLHLRWARKAILLLLRVADLRPAAIDVTRLIQAANMLERPEMHVLINRVVNPTILADPGRLTVDLLERMVRVLGGTYELRYLLATLAEDERAPADVREYAGVAVSDVFPLSKPVQRMLNGRNLRILCIQNIADGQGDEMVRVAPLLQALLDTYPDASAVVVTDRGYLYRHSRVTTISFDEPDRLGAALNGRIDVLLEFADDEQSQLNHDPALPRMVAAIRSSRPLAIDISQAKRWNEFVFGRVLIDGMDWASALTVDRPLKPSVYDPVQRLIAELGMPKPVGERPLTGEWLLGGQETPDVASEWSHLTAGSDGHPIALLNPFGGNARLKGFTPTAFPDLAQLIRALVEDGFHVVMAPSGQPWGTSKTCRDVLQMLAESDRHHVSMVDEGASPAAFIQRLLSFISRANVVVTVEGWMMHAAYLAGKPYRLLTLPASEPRTWQPWGRSTSQRAWVFTGEYRPERTPLPEQPRKRAWLELLQRITDPCWEPILQHIARSEDPDLRRLAIGAMGRCGISDARQLTSWLADPSHRVRAAAAATLLHYHRDALGKSGIPEASWLDAIRMMGEPRPQRSDVVAIGESALPALDTLLHVEDPVTRREAAICIETIRRSMAQTDGVVEVEPNPASPARRERSA